MKKYFFILLMVGTLLQAQTLTQEVEGTQTNNNNAGGVFVKQEGANFLNAVQSDDKFKVLNIEQSAEGTQYNINTAKGKEVTQNGTNVVNVMDMSKTSKKVNVDQESDVKQVNINTNLSNPGRTKQMIQTGTNIGNSAGIMSFGGQSYQGVIADQSNINRGISKTVTQTGTNIGNSVIFK
jgi:hypothetical protein